MSVHGEDGGDFFDRYNEGLEALGCGVRVAAPTCCTTDLMAVVDLDGRLIASLPTSIDPAALAAVMLLVERSFEEGVVTGRALERSGG